MSIQTTLVAIAARCDGPHCCRTATASGATLATARAELRSRHGWTISRAAGYERTYCPACASDHTRLVMAGVLSKDGLVRDEAAFDAYLDKRRERV